MNDTRIQRPYTNHIRPPDLTSDTEYNKDCLNTLSISVLSKYLAIVPKRELCKRNERNRLICKDITTYRTVVQKFDNPTSALIFFKILTYDCLTELII